MLKKGDKFEIPVGTKVHGCFPKSIADGYDGQVPFKIYKRSVIKEVHDVFDITRFSPEPKIVFGGPSGYWADVHPDLIVPVN